MTCEHSTLYTYSFMGYEAWTPCLLCEKAVLKTNHDRLLASLKEMGDWLSAGLQASRDAWPDAKCLEHTEEIFGRARAAVDAAEGLSPTQGPKP